MYIPKWHFFDKDSIWLVGSDPIERRHIRGVLVSLSSQVWVKLRMTDSAYLGPIESAMYFLACGIALSGHQDLQTKFYVRELSSRTFPFTTSNVFNSDHQTDRLFMYYHIKHHETIMILMVPNQQKPAVSIKWGMITIWDMLLFRGICIVPIFPSFFISWYL